MTTATKTTHTPGPWRIGDAGNTIFHPTEPSPLAYMVKGEDRRANARLIAAAPDLLEALTGAHAMLTLMGVDLTSHEEGRKIIAAIARATT